MQDTFTQSTHFHQYILIWFGTRGASYLAKTAVNWLLYNHSNHKFVSTWNKSHTISLTFMATLGVSTRLCWALRNFFKLQDCIHLICHTVHNMFCNNRHKSHFRQITWLPADLSNFCENLENPSGAHIWFANCKLNHSRNPPRLFLDKTPCKISLWTILPCSSKPPWANVNTTSTQSIYCTMSLNDHNPFLQHKIWGDHSHDPNCTHGFNDIMQNQHTLSACSWAWYTKLPLIINYHTVLSSSTHNNHSLELILKLFMFIEPLLIPMWKLPFGAWTRHITLMYLQNGVQ